MRNFCHIFEGWGADTHANPPWKQTQFKGTGLSTEWQASASGSRFHGVYVNSLEGVAMIHERLRIIGVEMGDQPFVSEDGNLILVANGEIYNYLELSAEIAKSVAPTTP